MLDSLFLYLYLKEDETMEIRPLDSKQYGGKLFTIHFSSDAYLDITPVRTGFRLEWVPFKKKETFALNDVMLADWLEHCSGLGAWENGALIGFAEICFDHGNSRCRLRNLCVFSQEDRCEGVGSDLLEAIEQEACRRKARMLTVSVRSCNASAIAFFLHRGFVITGFDRYAYTDHDPQRHEMKIFMGKRLEEAEKKID